jgi:virginiamycin B lyase
MWKSLKLLASSRACLAAGAAIHLVAGTAIAGGSNYGIAPGANGGYSGRVVEWAVPTPRFARDPAIAPDGSVFITVMTGNRVARFEPKTQIFREWVMPSGHRPHGLLVDRSGIVWTTGNGNGTIGRLDPVTGEIAEIPVPTGSGGPHTIVITDDQSTLWFTQQSGNRIGRLDIESRKVTEYPTTGGPYGLAIDQSGNLWFCRPADDRVGKLDPRTGQMTEVATGLRSRPRRMAVGADGTLWVTLYGNGKLARIDPRTGKIVKEYVLPGNDAGPYAVSVESSGIVWANEINNDTVVRLDPRTGSMDVVKLPSRNVGIRKLVVDAQGRLWYMGSHNGRLGMIE